MKICSIHIKGFQQFQDVFLDFTDPETGEPADKICFIGSNGTGKSTLLQLIKSLLEGTTRNYFSKASFLEITLKENGITNNYNYIDINKYKTQVFVNHNRNRNYTTIYSPAESHYNVSVIQGIKGLTLNQALASNKNQHDYHIVSPATANNFWLHLISLIKAREDARMRFENQPENLDKTKRQLNEEFDKIHPKIEEKLAEIWNKILAKAGLELDLRNIKYPTQLNESLHTSLRLIHSKSNIPYESLSTGIRNFIFRIGHICSLYFNRVVESGFLLVDEPENSLYPDFLLDLVDIYTEITRDKNGENNTQMFFATHNPIIAAQFKPHERVLLEWNNDGSVRTSKGTAPEGDDPNDVLSEDFKLKNLMGKAGMKAWEDYLALKKQLRLSNNPTEKMELSSKIMQLGTAYKF